MFLNSAIVADLDLQGLVKGVGFRVSARFPQYLGRKGFGQQIEVDADLAVRIEQS